MDPALPMYRMVSAGRWEKTSAHPTGECALEKASKATRDVSCLHHPCSAIFILILHIAVIRIASGKLVTIVIYAAVTVAAFAFHVFYAL